MNYKTTVLTKDVECKTAVFADIPDLLFGTLANGQRVFDFTDYCNKNDMEEFTHTSFMRLCKRQIEFFVRNEDVDMAEMFFMNTDGHILVVEELVVIFLMFVSMNFFLYANQMVINVLEDGMAFSDSMVVALAGNRLPTDILEGIIENRKNGEKGQ